MVGDCCCEPLFVGRTGAGGLALLLSFSSSSLSFFFSLSFPFSLSTSFLPSPCTGRGGTGRLRAGKAGEWLVDLVSFSSLFGDGGT